VGCPRRDTMPGIRQGPFWPKGPLWTNLNRYRQVSKIDTYGETKTSKSSPFLGRKKCSPIQSARDSYALTWREACHQDSTVLVILSS
jgi:hypothetical protein